MARLTSLDSIWKNDSPVSDLPSGVGQVRRVFVDGVLQEAKVAARKKTASRQEPGSDLVEALAHGLSILECWGAADTWLSNSVLADRSGLTRPTVSRLASVLVELGYLARHPTLRGSFRLAGAILELGFGNPMGSRAVSCAQPELSRLADELDVYAALGVRRLDQIQILENVPSPLHPNAVGADVGTLLPLCRSVAGLAALSALPAHRAAAVVEPLRVQYGEQWLGIDKQLNRSRLEYSSKGYCTAVAIFSEHVGAIAVPINLSGGDDAYVLACGVPAHDFYSHRIEQSIAPRMLKVVESLRKSLSS